MVPPSGRFPLARLRGTVGVRPRCTPCPRGYVFGTFQPATGDAFTALYRGRTTANCLDFLEQVDAWLPTSVERVYAILDTLSTHRAPDVLLFLLTHPRWELVFQPKYAAYLNLFEPWWKILRSLALKGRRFESWAEICQAITRQPPIGKRANIRLSGVVGAATGHGARPVSRSSLSSPKFPGCTT